MEEFDRYEIKKVSNITDVLLAGLRLRRAYNGFPEWKQHLIRWLLGSQGAFALDVLIANSGRWTGQE